MPEPYYCTAQDLRDKLGLDTTALSDAAAAAFIETAEDLIDEDLGARPIDETTGRKVVISDIETWQATKLKRATVNLAALLHAKPDLTDPGKYTEITGPDFSFKGPVGSRFGDTVDAPLNQSGLRRLTTTVGGGRARPPWYSFSYNVG